MEYFLPIAAKSFLVAGAALLLLQLSNRRSAAQRSWIAHLGLAATLLLPVAAIALPPFVIQGPAFLTPAPTEPAIAPVAATAKAAVAKDAAKFATESASAADTFPKASRAIDAARNVDWATWIYAAPAALLLLLTLIALGHLVTLRARANVLVEPNWLTALARAQQRMGYKHGTALLTSDELPSPISWGVMRPVILLNRDAAQSHQEAEAIIAHELAHVANLDWAKLLLSRVTVALFWFNPLVWVLAREAHQLREEAADDAVLNADIEDTDYANLLVGVARHECRGLLIGAHGVAPGRNSLSRRVRRVLDVSQVRGPIGRAFALGVFAGAALLAAPLAALTLTRMPVARPATGSVGKTPAQAAAPQAPYYIGGADSPAMESARDAADDATAAIDDASDAVDEAMADHAGLSHAEQHELQMELESARNELHGAQLHGPDSAAINAAVASAIAASRKASRISRIDPMAMFGVTPEYASAMRASSPRLARVGNEDLVAFKIHGVSPGYVRDLEASGLRGLSPEQLTIAAIHGVSGPFLRSMAAVGYPHLSFNDAVNMRIHGVTPDFVLSLPRRGIRNPSAAEVTRLRITGMVDPDSDVDVDDGS